MDFIEHPTPETLLTALTENRYHVLHYLGHGAYDEKTGAGWKDPRTGMHPEIPQRHWHLNDPGVVPNLLQTGGGSPTGICVYEGRLLPERFWDQLIHCDAGPNVVRAKEHRLRRFD